MENKGYAGFWGANKVYYGECGNGEYTSFQTSPQYPQLTLLPPPAPRPHLTLKCPHLTLKIYLSIFVPLGSRISQALLSVRKMVASWNR